ncbi:hypothetical protein [Capnocytophaga sp. oral taxon 878]|uniref:hypothetical protein n=1 Tax=Capnocytophaga sp. oral taxon 878 TaxID=1316596 RepID=UPI000D0228FA|nr:hypothetical protein [Capnocytophaga sp. oral taxon 878]AVM49606.1 hypothetical protein C4H12_03510 [Capnocytophaga sp. oral taxon 878]
MKYIYLLSLITLLYSCNIIKTSNCSPYNIIEITNWGTNEIDKKNFILYEYDTLNVFLKTIDINEIRVYNKTTNPDYYGSMRIFLKTSLCPDKSYKLIISDSLQYNIQEMDMISFYKRAMLSKVHYRGIKSYKVNNIKLSPKEAHVIYFDKDLAIPYNKE